MRSLTAMMIRVLSEFKPSTAAAADTGVCIEILLLFFLSLVFFSHKFASFFNVKIHSREREIERNGEITTGRVY
jgi:hypothetical protein